MFLYSVIQVAKMCKHIREKKTDFEMEADNLNKRKQNFLPAIIVIVIMVILIGGYAVGTCMAARPGADEICEGVFIDKVDAGGMTREEAQTALEDHVGRLAERSLEVDVNGEPVSATLADIGYSCEIGDVITQALQVGKGGNLFSNYSEIKKVAEEKKVFPLSFSYSEKKLNNFVKNKCGDKCTNAKNAKIKMKNGELTYTEAKQGVSIDVDATVEAIKAALQEQEEEDTVVVEAVVTVQEPKVTKDLAIRCKDKIGSYTTSFNAGNISRSRNVSNAARLINGTVIYPGETFSVHDAISPLTEENGYYDAPSYSNGQVVDSIGGGVCQVSTTLYNAVLRAELEVVERSPHSMVVTYVEPSMDAAIAGDYKDFKFRNNTEVPVYIQGGTYTGNIYFNIYGEETRPSDRTVTFESEVIETIEPGQDKITYDKSKPASYSEVTQEAHTGYKAVLWKIVKENGETEKTQVNSSTYKAEPRYITKGAAEATPKPSATPKTDKKKDNDTKDSKKTQKPKATATPKPAATATPEPEATQAPTVEPEAE